ncbi:MAG: efflux RND transporter periplasmic adaptor subunit [Chloroflexi bacterium]|nr:MAG: efflux RND transporter periplasmic adaptor subunit [Chloroflexota bacterium]
MKRNHTIIGLFLLTLILWTTTACAGSAEPVSAAPAAEGERAVPVTTAQAETGDISLVFNYAGVLQARHDVKILPRVSGMIEEVLVEVGDHVQAGDPLARIENALYAAQLKQARGALSEARLTLQKMKEGARPEEIAAARSAVEIARAALADAKTIDDNERTAAALNLANARAALRLAQSEYDKIAWAGQVAMTPQALKLEQATNAYQAALAAYNLQTNPAKVQLAPLEAQLVQAELKLALAEEPFRPVDFEIVRAKIQQAEAAVEQAQLQMDYAVIRAPFDGVVSEVYIHKGSLVAPQVPTVRLLSDELEAVINVEESRVAQVQQGQPVGLKVSAYPDREFPAVVSSVAPAADEKTHTFVVKISPQDREGRLRSGMYADVSILAAERQQTTLVPLAAVTTVDGQSVVYVVGEDGRVEQRRVEVGLTDAAYAEILSGVAPGEVVVVSGQANLQDGVKVKPTEL